MKRKLPKFKWNKDAKRIDLNWIGLIDLTTEEASKVLVSLAKAMRKAEK